MTEWSEVMATCSVCRHLDGDLAPKRVKFCQLCDSWMCETCWDSPVRRARAAVGQLIQRLA